MAMRIDPAKKRIFRYGKDGVLTIDGDFTVTGIGTIPNLADTAVTASVGVFTVGSDLTVVNDAAMGRDVAVVRDLTVGRALTMSGGSAVVFTLTDTTTPCTFDITMADTLCTIGTITNHSLVVRTNNVTALTIAGSGAATFAAAVTISGTALTLSNAATPTLTITDTTNTVSLVAKSGDTVSTVGTSTNHDLVLISNNTTRITVAAAGGVTIAGALTQTGAATLSSTLAVNGASITLTNATDPIISVIDSTNTCTLVAQALNTTAKLGTTSAHDLLVVAGGTTAITVAAADQQVTSAAKITAPSLTLSGASGVVLTMTDTTTPCTLTITMADTTATINTSTAHSLVLAANSVTAMTIASTGIVTHALAAVFTLGAQVAAVARTATADGLTTGLIALGTSFVAVTAGADANSIITLPTSAPVGTLIRAWVGATGHEIRTTSASNETINNVDADGGAFEAAIPAATLWQAEKVSSTAWTLTAVDELGAVIAAIVPHAV